MKKGDKHTPGICTAVSILLKERNMGMSGLQTFTSLVLFSARVSQKVYILVTWHAKTYLSHFYNFVETDSKVYT